MEKIKPNWAVANSCIVLGVLVVIIVIVVTAVGYSPFKLFIPEYSFMALLSSRKNSFCASPSSSPAPLHPPRYVDLFVVCMAFKSSHLSRSLCHCLKRNSNQIVTITTNDNVKDKTIHI